MLGVAAIDLLNRCDTSCRLFCSQIEINDILDINIGVCFVSFPGSFAVRIIIFSQPNVWSIFRIDFPVNMPHVGTCELRGFQEILRSKRLENTKQINHARICNILVAV